MFSHTRGNCLAHGIYHICHTDSLHSGHWAYVSGQSDLSKNKTKIKHHFVKITSLFSKNKTNFSLTNTHIFLLFLCKIPLFYTAHLFLNYYSISNLLHIGMSSNFLSDSYLKLIYSSIIIQFLMSLTLG